MVRIAAPIVFRSNSLYNNRSNALLIFGHCKVDRKANLDRSRKINDECSKRSTEKDESILHTSRYQSDSGKIYCGEGFSNFTADQWKIFFTIYATVSLWDHLEYEDRKILTYFMRVCQLFVNRIVEVDAMREAHRKLIEIVKLIENNHGRDKITLNLHLSLHLSECSFDYGPLYTFWCRAPNRVSSGRVP